jgi:hypothetical protein
VTDALAMPPASAPLWKDTLLATAIVLIASSLSPFALADAGVLRHQVFYVTLMPCLALYVFGARSIRINPYVGIVLASQIVIVLLVLLVDGLDGLGGQLKTVGTLLSILLVSVLFSSRLLDIRVFVHVAVLFTLGVLLLATASLALAYWGYAVPEALYYRAGGDQLVYRVGYTLTNELYPVGSGYFIRPSGVFVEAGQLAMYASLAMMANAVVLRNRVYEALLIVLGLFITSLAFYLFLLAFFLVFRRWKALALYLAGFAAVVLLAGGHALIREDVVLDHVLGRTISFFTETLGGNRAASTWAVATHLDELRALGAAKDDAFLGVYADATVFGPFLRYGLFGGPFIYLHVLLFAAVPLLLGLQAPRGRVVRTQMPAIFALLALNLFQRPFTLHFLYYVYLIAMFEWELRRYAASGRPCANVPC